MPVRASLLVVLLLLAACGAQEPLRPPPGQSLPVRPAAAPDTPMPEELLTPPVTAQPERVDELLTESTDREEDRFDLPPQS